MAQILFWGMIVLFPVSEIALALFKHSGGQGVQSEDRGSMRQLWLSIMVGIGLAIAAQWVPSAHLPGPPHLLRLLALLLLVVGIVLRWTAIITLGRLFTVDVAIQADHVVYQSGLYRFMRHPSYSGLLVMFLGLGLVYANWLSILGLLIPIVFGVMNRVEKEEQALLAALGAEYSDYCSKTKRFIPGLI